MANFDRAMTLRADFADAHFNAALFLLLVGELSPGWYPTACSGMTRRAMDQIIAAVAAALQATRVAHSSVNNFKTKCDSPLMQAGRHAAGLAA